jgi:hypothetical protein
MAYTPGVYGSETITPRDVEVRAIWCATGRVCDGYETCGEGRLVRRVSTDDGPVMVCVAEPEERGAMAYTVIGDYALDSETVLHSDTDLDAAIRWARWWTTDGNRDMGGYETVEVIWHMDSGEAVVEWSARAVVAS